MERAVPLMWQRTTGTAPNRSPIPDVPGPLCERGAVAGLTPSPSPDAVGSNKTEDGAFGAACQNFHAFYGIRADNSARFGKLITPWQRVRHNWPESGDDRHEKKGPADRPPGCSRTRENGRGVISAGGDGRGSLGGLDRGEGLRFHRLGTAARPARPGQRHLGLLRGGEDGFHPAAFLFHPGSPVRFDLGDNFAGISGIVAASPRQETIISKTETISTPAATGPQSGENA